MDLTLLIILYSSQFESFFYIKKENMMNWKRKVASVTGEYLGRDFMKKLSDITNELETWTSKNPLNGRNANPANEDEYMKEYAQKKKKFKSEQINLHPIQRPVSTWNKKDLDTVMQSKDYLYDDYTKKKVQKYFEWKYPGKQRLDATGRPY